MHNVDLPVCRKAGVKRYWNVREDEGGTKVINRSFWAQPLKRSSIELMLKVIILSSIWLLMWLGPLMEESRRQDPGSFFAGIGVLGGVVILPVLLLLDYHMRKRGISKLMSFLGVLMIEAICLWQPIIPTYIVVMFIRIMAG